MKYRIKSQDEFDDGTDYHLYWNNKDGWTRKRYATIFTEEEKGKFNLPMASEWEEIKPRTTKNMSDKKIKISKNPNVNWKNNQIQFARFIAEAEAAGVFEEVGLKDMADSMDLSVEEVTEIIDRAQHEWDEIKARTGK